jgi:hypothetical protein
MDMDRFVNEQNLARFRRLVSATITAAERKMLLVLLAEEEAKFVALNKALVATAVRYQRP